MTAKWEASNTGFERAIGWASLIANNNRTWSVPPDEFCDNPWNYITDIALSISLGKFKIKHLSAWKCGKVDRKLWCPHIHDYNHNHTKGRENQLLGSNYSHFPYLVRRINSSENQFWSKTTEICLSIVVYLWTR